MVSCRVPADWLNDVSQCWYDWQTLVGGVSALVAAGVTVYLLWKQIDQTNEIESDRVGRQHRSARAVVSLALSQICIQSQAIIRDISALRRQQFMARALELEDIELPQFALSESVIDTLSDFLETTDDVDLVAVVFKLITKLQVTTSRLIDLDATSDNALDMALLDAAKVYAISESLFEYARRETDTAPSFIAWARVRTALNLSDARREACPDVHDAIDRREVQAPNYWTTA